MVLKIARSVYLFFKRYDILFGHILSGNCVIQVNEEEARQFAEENGVHAFIETSAKLGENIQEAFYAGARTALERAKATNSTDMFLPAASPGTTSLNRPPPKSCSGGC